MPTINLREFYPAYYTQDQHIDVPDEVAAVFRDAERQERNYRRRVRYNRAYYSLNAGEGIEKDMLCFCPSPEKIYEGKMAEERVRAAIDALPDTQRRRVYEHYILGLSKSEIARREGLVRSRVNDSIKRGLVWMKKYFQNFC